MPIGDDSRLKQLANKYINSNNYNNPYEKELIKTRQKRKEDSDKEFEKMKSDYYGTDTPRTMEDIDQGDYRLTNTSNDTSSNDSSDNTSTFKKIIGWLGSAAQPSSENPTNNYNYAKTYMPEDNTLKQSFNDLYKAFNTPQESKPMGFQIEAPVSKTNEINYSDPIYKGNSWHNVLLNSLNSGVNSANVSKLQIAKDLYNILPGDQSNTWLNQKLNTAQGQLENEQAQMQNEMQNYTGAKKFVSTGLQAVPQIVETIAPGVGLAKGLGLTGKVAKAVQLLPFGVEAGGGYSREAELEGAGLADRITYGVLGGLAEAATEYLPLSNFMKAVGGKYINQGAKTLLGRYGKTGLAYLGNVGLEAGQEALVDPFTGLAKKATYDKDMSWYGEGGVLDPTQMKGDAYAGASMAVILGALGLPSTMASHRLASQYVEQGKTPTEAEINVLNNQLQQDAQKVNQVETPQETQPTVNNPVIEEQTQSQVLNNSAAEPQTGETTQSNVIAPVENKEPVKASEEVNNKITIPPYDEFKKKTSYFTDSNDNPYLTYTIDDKTFKLPYAKKYGTRQKVAYEDLVKQIKNHNNSIQKSTVKSEQIKPTKVEPGQKYNLKSFGDVEILENDGSLIKMKLKNGAPAPIGVKAFNNLVQKFNGYSENKPQQEVENPEDKIIEGPTTPQEELNQDTPEEMFPEDNNITEDIPQNESQTSSEPQLKEKEVNTLENEKVGGNRVVDESGEAAAEVVPETKPVEINKEEVKTEQKEETTVEQDKEEVSLTPEEKEQVRISGDKAYGKVMKRKTNNQYTAKTRKGDAEKARNEAMFNEKQKIVEDKMKEKIILSKIAEEKKRDEQLLKEADLRNAMKQEGSQYFRPASVHDVANNDSVQIESDIKKGKVTKEEIERIIDFAEDTKFHPQYLPQDKIDYLRERLAEIKEPIIHQKKVGDNVHVLNNQGTSEFGTITKLNEDGTYEAKISLPFGDAVATIKQSGHNQDEFKVIEIKQTKEESPKETKQEVASTEETPKEDTKPSIGATDRTKSMQQIVSSDENKSKKTFKEKAHNTYTRLVDTNHPIKGVDEDTYIKATNTRSAGGTVDYILQDALVDMQGNKIGESLKDIVKDIPKGEEKDFMNYVLQRHNIDRAREESIKLPVVDKQGFLVTDKDGNQVYKDKITKDSKPVYKDFTSEESAKAVKIIEKHHPEYKDLNDRLVKFINTFENEWGYNSGLMTKELWEHLQATYKNYVPTQRDFTELEEGFNKTNGRGLVDQTTPIDKATGSDRDIIDPIENIMHLVNRTVRTARYNQAGQSLLNIVRNDPDKFKRFAEIIPEDEKINPNVKNIVSVLENGKPVNLKINDKALLGALQNINKVNVGEIEAALKKGTNLFKSLITTKNPLFAFTNIARDIPTAYIYGSQSNPFKFIRDLIKAGNQLAKNKDQAQRYHAVGGGGANFFNSEKTSRNAKELTHKSVFRNIIDHIEAFNNILESTPRLAEFNRVLQKTGDVQKALYAASEVSTNFSKYGDVTKHIDSAFPYTNAGVQGLDKLVRQFKNKPIPTIAKGLIGITTATLVTALINDDNDNYRTLDNRTKDNYFLIPVGEKFIKIPKSRELGVLFGSLFERLIRYAEGDPEAFKGYMNTILTNFSPTNPIENSIFSPIYNLKANKDFANRTIVPESMVSDKRSKYLQFDEKTSEITKQIAAAVHNIGIEVSPKQIDYLIKSYTGVIGQFLLPLTTNSEGSNPLVNKFVADPLYSNQIVQDFYDNYNNIQRIATDKNINENIPSKKLTKEESVKAMFRKAADDITDINKEITKAQSSGDTEKVKALRNKLIQTALTANMKYKQ